MNFERHCAFLSFHGSTQCLVFQTMLITLIIITIISMNKDQSLSNTFNDFLFRIGLAKKKFYVLQKDGLDAYASQIVENAMTTEFSFSNDIDNSILFDDLNDALNFFYVYNDSNFAIDTSDTNMSCKCLIVPVMVSQRHNQTFVSTLK